MGNLLPKTESYYLIHIHKVKFYPSGDNFTQALLVMLVTNIISVDGFFMDKTKQEYWPFIDSHAGKRSKSMCNITRAN